MKLTDLLEQIILEAEEASTDPEVKELEKAMGDAFKALGSGFTAEKEELKQDVQNAEVPVNEALTPVAVIGVILAMPKVVEFIGKGMSKLVTIWKKFFKRGEAKTEEEKVQVAEKIIEFSHKWHKLYINGLKGMLRLIGAFDKAGIKGDANQTKAAEMLYYIIIAGLAVYSGVGAFNAFKTAATTSANGGTIALGTLESAMAAIKSGEVGEFLTKMALK